MIVPQILASFLMAIVIMSSACNAGTESARSVDEQVESLLPKEKDRFMAEVARCWNVGVLSTATLQVKVVVQFEMTPMGKPNSGSIQMMSFEGGDEDAAKQAYQAARRTIIRCGATGYKLPIEKYEQWKTINITFNPSNRSLR